MAIVRVGNQGRTYVEDPHALAGDDWIILLGQEPPIYGFGGNDTIEGGSADDTIYGGYGNDLISTLR